MSVAPDLPDVMEAVLLTGHGGYDRLEYRTDVRVPRPGADEVLVRVRACGLNNTDVNTRTGWYSSSARDGITAEGAAGGFNTRDDIVGGWRQAIDFPRIQGADVCGEVAALGSGVDANGLLARRVLIDPWWLDPADPGDRSKARYFGSEVDGGFAQYCVAPVANIHPIESGLTDAELATFACSTGTARVDAIADVVGGTMFEQLVPLLRRGGRYATSGAIAGPIVELDLRTLIYGDLRFGGATVCPSGTFARVVAAIEGGAVRPVLAATYPLAGVVAAQQAFVAKQHIGNIVMEVP